MAQGVLFYSERCQTSASLLLTVLFYCRFAVIPIPYLINFPPLDSETHLSQYFQPNVFSLWGIRKCLQAQSIRGD